MPTASPSAYDLIVVGTGPGGATVARDMALRGKKVLLLEWGPRAARSAGNVWQGLNELMVPGKSLPFTPQGLGMMRGITTGGSSMFYYACAWPVPLDMFRRYGVDLADDAAAARAELPIAPLSDAMILTAMASDDCRCGHQASRQRNEPTSWRPPAQRAVAPTSSGRRLDARQRVQVGSAQGSPRAPDQR